MFKEKEIEMAKKATKKKSSGGQIEFVPFDPEKLEVRTQTVTREDLDELTRLENHNRRMRVTLAVLLRRFEDDANHAADCCRWPDGCHGCSAAGECPDQDSFDIRAAINNQTASRRIEDVIGIVELAE